MITLPKVLRSIGNYVDIFSPTLLFLGITSSNVGSKINCCLLLVARLLTFTLIRS